MSDATAFLWRSELAGHPRDAAAWRAMYEYANSALPRPGSGLADLHVILAQAVMGDDAALDVRAGHRRWPVRGWAGVRKPPKHEPAGRRCEVMGI